MSREQIYKVVEDVLPLNNWIKYTREKGENDWVGEVNNCEFSKEKSENEKVSAVRDCTRIWASEVRSKSGLRVGVSRCRVCHNTNYQPNIVHSNIGI